MLQHVKITPPFQIWYLQSVSSIHAKAPEKKRKRNETFESFQWSISNYFVRCVHASLQEGFVCSSVCPFVSHELNFLEMGFLDWILVFVSRYYFSGSPLHVSRTLTESFYLFSCLSPSDFFFLGWSKSMDSPLSRPSSEFRTSSSTSLA